MKKTKPKNCCVHLLLEIFILYLHSQIDFLRIFWPVRLVVRTPGFHPGNRGSIPLRATTLGPFV